MAGDNTINKNSGTVISNPTIQKTPSTPRSGTSGNAPITPTGVGSAPDVASEGAALNRLTGPRGFRSSPLLSSVTPSEKKLPGGSIDAAWDRLAEYGPQADVAATVVAERRGMLS